MGEVGTTRNRGEGGGGQEHLGLDLIPPLMPSHGGELHLIGVLLSRYPFSLNKYYPAGSKTK